MCYRLRALHGDLMVYQDARRSDKDTGSDLGQYRLCTTTMGFCYGPCLRESYCRDMYSYAINPI